LHVSWKSFLNVNQGESFVTRNIDGNRWWKRLLEQLCKQQSDRRMASMVTSRPGKDIHSGMAAVDADQSRLPGE
jgi:hypothetical protein